MSMDMHKYGCTTKGLQKVMLINTTDIPFIAGISIVCYAQKEMVHYQYSVVLDWPGMDLEQHT